MLKYIRQGTLTLDQLTSKQLFEILTYNDEDELTIFSDVGSESSLVVSNHMIGYLFRDNKLIAEFTFTDDGEVQGIFPYTNIHEVLSLTIELMDPNGMSAINGQVLYWEKGEFVDKITN